MPKVINNRIATAASEIASDACHSLRHATKSHRSGATIAKIPKAFLVQSNYVAWLFAVEILQTLYRWAVGRGVYSSVAAAAITAVAIGLSVPATVQHFIYWRNPGHFFGNGNRIAETFVLGDCLAAYPAAVPSRSPSLRE